ncbi:MAG: hypothetical protein U9P81_08920 [Euryarchaeota archaeon]|nr:hypothetical protein [Euryarchaeota archaeon]
MHSGFKGTVTQAGFSVEGVRRAVDSVDTVYPDSVVVDYYDADGEWFERSFGCY